MTWARFGYICRKASVDCWEREPLSDCLKRIEAEPACALYGAGIPADSWPRKVLDKIGHMNDRASGLSAIQTYRNLDLGQQLEEPLKFRRVVAYLGYVIFIFYGVVGLYQLRITPAFLQVFDSLEVQIPLHLLMYQQYWGYLIVGISVFMLLALLIGHEMRKLFRFCVGVECGFVFKYLLFRSIKQSYLRLLQIIQFPIGQERGAHDPISDHLTAVRDSGMDVSEEMRALINVEVQSLTVSCEQQMKLLSALIALMVVATVFFFLVSAYSPIFILGDAI